jgi:uncharacterized protein YeaO (DUF488 family)
MLKLKRIYQPVEPGDGYRVLVDRLWPRGIRKDSGRFDVWNKDVAPSFALCKWFAHDPAKWVEFQSRYKAELEGRESQLQELAARARKEPVTLIYAARDEEHNQALVLKNVLDTML